MNDAQIKRIVSGTPLSWADLLRGTLQAFQQRLELSPAHLYAAAVTRTPRRTRGVYLIYDAKNVLLYVGESQDVKKRLLSHAAPQGYLMRHVLGERDLELDAPRGHVCVCGAKIRCHAGAELPSNRAQLLQAIQYEIKTTYRVRVLAGDFKEFEGGRGRRGVESFVQWLLRPKYSLWRDPENQSRWIKLPSELPIPQSRPKDEGHR